MTEEPTTPAATPAVTVVIATRDRPGLLQGALSAIGNALRPRDRVVVVDSASAGDEVAGVARSAGATTVRCDTPGASRARNAGWRASTTPIIAFTDDDCLVDAGWVTALAGAFQEADVDFVTGRVVAERERRGRGQLGLSVLDGAEPLRFGPGDDAATIGHGSNMAWRRATLEALAGFDESLGPGADFRAAEDHDLFWRALRRGSRGRFEPGAVVVHRQWRNRREQLATYHAYGIGSGALAAKQRRLGPDRAPGGSRSPLEELLWDRGVRSVARNLRLGYEMSAAAEAAKVTGVLRGWLTARNRTVADGHFGPR